MKECNWHWWRLENGHWHCWWKCECKGHLCLWMSRKLDF